MPKHDDSRLKCSFCGKSQDQVKKLIAGPEVYICDEIYAADGSLWYYIKTIDSGKYGFCHSAFIRKEV